MKPSLSLSTALPNRWSMAFLVVACAVAALGMPLAVSAADRAPPRVGEHTNEILREIGEA